MERTPALKRGRGLAVHGHVSCLERPPRATTHTGQHQPQPAPNTPFVQASGQLLPYLYHALHKAGPALEEGHDYKTNPFVHESDNTFNLHPLLVTFTSF